MNKITKKVAVKTTKYAVRNPFRFKKRLGEILTYLRWVKYLVPMIGAFNKLKENSMDLYKKILQYRQARIAQKIRASRWKNMSEEQRKLEAVTRMQAIFRARSVKKNQKALRIFTMNKELFAVIKIQNRIRQKAVNAKKKVEEKRKELKKLQGRRRDITNDLTFQDKMRTIELRDELRLREKIVEEQRSLLRPNTNFAVLWKTLFVFTVLLEILQLILGESDDEKRSLEDILSSALLPVDGCEDMEAQRKTGPLKKVGNFFKNISRKKNNTEIATSSGLSVCKAILPPFKRYQLLLIHYFISYFVYVVSTICFLDVFVTFFTGDLHPENGIIEPKPFFKRWVAPGILVQLLTNPTMKNVSGIVKSVAGFINETGPGRVARWIFAIEPLMSFFWLRISEMAKSFVQAENKRLMLK